MTTTLTDYKTIESTVELIIYDHHFDPSGEHKTSTLRNSAKFCPSCRGAWSREETGWDQKYRNEKALTIYNEDLARVSDINLQAVLILGQDYKIAAIKMLRSLYPTIGLFNAKRIVELCSVETVVTYKVSRG